MSVTVSSLVYSVACSIDTHPTTIITTTVTIHPPPNTHMYFFSSFPSPHSYGSHLHIECRPYLCFVDNSHNSVVMSSPSIIFWSLCVYLYVHVPVFLCGLCVVFVCVYMYVSYHY
eukprot:m.36993 g.36993  ORF g.36993 m.36993 type:complete len:115 (+) comp11337_c0_seq1:76-420(+)